MATISETYRQTAIEGMSLNITEDEMFILIPSERGNNSLYRVDMDEATMQPTSCKCPGFCRWQHCKHCTIVAEAFAGYVAPVVATPVVVSAEPRITEIEAGTWYQINSNTVVYKVDGSEWIVSGSYPNAIAIVEAHLAVKEAERIVATPVVTAQPATESRKVSSVVSAKIAEAARIIASGTYTPNAVATKVLKDDEQTTAKENAVERMLDAALTSNRGFSLLR